MFTEHRSRSGSKLFETVVTVKPVFSGHLKIDKTKVLKANDSLMKVESTAECSLGAFCNTFDLHLAIIGLENQFLVFFLSGRLRQVLLHSQIELFCMFLCCLFFVFDVYPPLSPKKSF